LDIIVLKYNARPSLPMSQDLSLDWLDSSCEDTNTMRDGSRSDSESIWWVSYFSWG